MEQGLKDRHVMLPRDLSRQRNLEPLLAVLQPFVEGVRAAEGGVRAKEIAIALNHVKRLQWQVRVWGRERGGSEGGRGEGRGG